MLKKIKNSKLDHCKNKKMLFFAIFISIFFKKINIFRYKKSIAFALRNNCIKDAIEVKIKS